MINIEKMKSKIEDYKVVVRQYNDDFSLAVMKEIGNGYELYGSPYHKTSKDRCGIVKHWHCQALVKYEKKH